VLDGLTPSVKYIRDRSGRVACFSRNEARTVRKQVRRYFAAPLVLPDEPVIVDAGAHVGMFCREVMRRVPRATVYAFEPSPLTFALLTMNTYRFGEHVQRVNLGLCDRACTKAFWHYPHTLSLSGIQAPGDVRPHTEAVYEMLSMRGSDYYRFRALRLLPRVLVLRLLDVFVRHYVKASETHARFITLSDAIDRHVIPRIDLLKIDVERSEMELLAGIRAEHWPLVRNVVMEIHDRNGQTDEIEAILRRHGFTEISTQLDSVAPDEQVFLLHAAR